MKLFQLANADLFLFLQHAYSIYKVRKPRMTKLGHTTLYLVILFRFLEHPAAGPAVERDPAPIRNRGEDTQYHQEI